MKTKFLSLLCTLLALLTPLGSVGGCPLSVRAAGDADAKAVSRVRDLADGILSHQLQSVGADSVQKWLDGALTENAGKDSEWWVLSLSRSGIGLDYTAYAEALTGYLSTMPTVSAATRQKYALVLLCISSDDLPCLDSVPDDTIGKGGIMSYVFGLHLLTWGVPSSLWTTDSVIVKLLEMRLSDGGWAVTGGHGDVDVTAMTLQALAPYRERPGVAEALDEGVTFLSGKQQSDGTYQSYGVKNAESVAQVTLALTSLGLDPITDVRFHVGGRTLLDGLESFRMPDGSFCHVQGGGSNGTATVQSYLALISMLRLWEGKGGVYQPDDSSIITPNPPQSGENPPITTASSPQTGENPSVTTKPAQTGEKPPITSANPPQTGYLPGSEEKNPVLSSTETLQTGDKPSPSSTNAGTGTPPAGGGSIPVYKVVGTAVLIVAAAGIGLILWLRGRRHPGNFFLLAGLTLIVVLILWVVRIQRPEDYYQEEPPAPETGPCVYLSIRCDSLLGIADPKSIPKGGVILPETRFALSEGETVYDILLRAVKSRGIQMENNGTSELAYIAGIGYLYEFDYGDLSGWMYFVNGESPSVGCSSYTLSDGDVIQWRYTTNMGEDLKG